MKAFTLVEALVAVTVVLLAVLGPFQLVKDSLTASYVARDQMTATALAEEGLEYIRGVRDQNYLHNLQNPTSPRTWLQGLNGGGSNPDCFPVRGCVVDPLSTAAKITNCTNSACPPLRTTAAGTYTQQLSGTTATRFTRKVRLEHIATDRSVRVTVTVTFSTRHSNFTVTTTDILYNWLYVRAEPFE